MLQRGVDLPAGYRLAFFDSVDSTNAEGLRAGLRGEEGGLWIWAGEQQDGRGRAGRNWVSHDGNLYTSLVLRPRVPLAIALQLSLLAGVAAHDAVAALASGAGVRPDARLKWPNDILVNGAKLGGILLESAAGGGNGDPVVVVGTGLNLAQAPGDLGRSATCLKDLGVGASAREAIAALAWTTAEWLARWNEGLGFETIRAAWLARAQGLGTAMTVRFGSASVTGAFSGLDEDGALRLGMADGTVRRVTAGDVSLGPEA